MLSYSEQRKLDILSVVWMVEEQIRMNQLWIAMDIPVRYNSEGRMVPVEKQALSFLL